MFLPSKWRWYASKIVSTPGHLNETGLPVDSVHSIRLSSDREHNAVWSWDVDKETFCVCDEIGRSVVGTGFILLLLLLLPTSIIFIPAISNMFKNMTLVYNRNKFTFWTCNITLIPILYWTRFQLKKTNWNQTDHNLSDI